MRTTAFAVLAFSLALGLASCGGSGVQVPGAGPDAGPDTQQMGLPALTELAPPHQVSIQGPGWYEINPEDTVALRGEQPSPPDEITLAAEGQPAFALYGILGFDGDCFPTSVRLTLSDVSGEYLVGFSDFAAGTWRFSSSFVGSATVEIPELDEHTSPTAYTSPLNRHYFAIVIPNGGGMSVEGVELGVHGGSLGPAPPPALSASGGENAFVLTWTHSPDYAAPDFAGYVLERAPLLEGDFGRLTPEPVMVNHFQDDTAAVDTTYRYRAAAIDASGNLSVWISRIDGPESGTQCSPVAVLDIPRGPLFGPVNVQFDLSGSYDPEGDPLDTYSIALVYAPYDVTQPDPVFDVVLQPGCYHIAAEVTAGVRTGNSHHRLVVYPTWAEDSVVVREPELCGWECRLLYMQAARHPSTERLVLFGFDPTIPALVIWHLTPDGTGADLYRLPAYSDPATTLHGVKWIGEPVAAGGKLYAPVCASAQFMLAEFDGNQARWHSIVQENGMSQVVAATDGSSDVWLFYVDMIAADQDLMVDSLAYPSGARLVEEDLADGLISLDAVYNHSQGVVDVVYRVWDGFNDSVRWLQWDPVTGPTGVSGTLGGASGGGRVDAEINPVSGEPAVVYHRDDGATAYNVFTEYDGAVWSVPVSIDDTDNNGTAFDFVYGDDAAYAYFKLWGGDVKLYDNSGGWAPRNTVSLADAGANVALAAIPGGSDVLVADKNTAADIYVAALHDDGTDTVHDWHLMASEGQGFEMHGTGGQDGLHVVYHSWTGGAVRHCTSADGQVWTETGAMPPGVMSMDMTTNLAGDVYCSFVSGGSARLMVWDGGGFANVLDIANVAANNRPFFMHDPTSVNMLWAVDSDAPPHAHVGTFGNEVDGYGSFGDLIIDPPIWTGAIMPPGFFGVEQCFALAGGASPDEGNLGLFGFASGVMDPLLNPLLVYPLALNVAQESWGRTLTAAAYAMPQYGLNGQVAYASHGSAILPIRYDIPFALFGEAELTELPMQSEFAAIDAKRTVSTIMGWGKTAVTLISNMGGEDTWFEWSNFGDWERLPLPELEHMTMPELIVGMDGRWHIVYKNFLTDQIMCRSTPAL